MTSPMCTCGAVTEWHRIDCGVVAAAQPIVMVTPDGDLLPAKPCTPPPCPPITQVTLGAHRLSCRDSHCRGCAFTGST